MAWSQLPSRSVSVTHAHTHKVVDALSVHGTKQKAVSKRLKAALHQYWEGFKIGGLIQRSVAFVPLSPDALKAVLALQLQQLAVTLNACVHALVAHLHAWVLWVHLCVRMSCGTTLPCGLARVWVTP